MSRFMLFVYNDPNIPSETFDQGPPAELVAKMTRFNEELAKAGVLLALDGLTPPSKAARVHFPSGGKPKVTDGPFAEAKEQIGGFWIVDVPDLDAALRWAAEGSKACQGKVEVRPFQDEPAA